MPDRLLGFFTTNYISDPLGYAEGRIRRALIYGGRRVERIGLIVQALAFHTLAYNDLYEATNTLIQKMEKEIEEKGGEAYRAFESDDPQGAFTAYVTSESTGKEAFEVERLLALLLSEAVVLGERISSVTAMLVSEFPGIWGMVAAPTGKGAKKKIRAHLVNKYAKSIDDLRRMEEWRDRHVHEQSWFVGAVGEPWELWFADEFMWPEWVMEVGTRFSLSEVKATSRALKDFAQWWIISAEVQIGTLPDHLLEKIKGTDTDLPVVARRS